jgi:YesN/AraC family two-component response regulator
MTDDNIRLAAGTGIGLSLVKGITEMHHGIVSVESEPGEWASFRVILPVGNQHFSPDEIFNDYVPSEHISNYLQPDDSYGEDEIPAPTVYNTTKFTLLLIDDNADIRQYIKSRLSNDYNIIEAADGKEGLTKAMQRMPDLIISDIMMPEIDGLQLCLKLKNDIHTSHIPIILLTARTTYLHVKEGFEVGADDYIIKPFNANLLRLKINSVLANRERLKQSLGKKLPFELTASETTSMDEQFLSKVYQIIEKNISNPDFLIDDLSKEIGMSRASLYRKIKALTDSSANEFIKKYRLQVAKKYLRETDLSISEISYKTGFKNPAYFTNCFKKAYKMSPSKYLQSIDISYKGHINN